MPRPISCENESPTFPVNSISVLKDLIKELSYLSPNLAFDFKYKSKEVEHICSKEGIKDYLKDIVGTKHTITKPFYAEVIEGRIGVKLALQYTNAASDTYKLFTNSIPNKAGTHLTGFRTALTQCVNKFAKDNNLLKAKDTNLTGDELKEGLNLVLSLTMPDPVFSGQTKETLTSSEGRTIVQRLVTTELSQWLAANPKESKALVEKALLARKAREAARKASEAVKTGKTKDKGLKAKLAFSDKIKDCSTHDPKNNTLLIVEGLSAGSAAIEARDPKTQAIMMLRGKTLSVLKSTDDKVYSNAVYKDLIAAIGAGIGKTFDVNKMNYNKIVITSDADSDGANIELLLTTFFFTYMRPLVEAGKLYRAVTPLYILRKKGRDPIYCYTQEEYEAIDTKGYEVTRLKG